MLSSVHFLTIKCSLLQLWSHVYAIKILWTQTKRSSCATKKSIMQQESSMPSLQVIVHFHYRHPCSSLIVSTICLGVFYNIESRLPVFLQVIYVLKLRKLMLNAKFLRSFKFSPHAKAVQQGNISCSSHLSTHSRVHHPELKERNNQPKTKVKD